MPSTKNERPIEDKVEKSVHAEDDPMSEPAPQDCNAIPAECEFVADERDGQAQNSEFKVHSELDDAFPVEEIPLVFLPDGMPSPVDSQDGLPLAHPFTIESVVCIEDEREYVEIFSEELRHHHTQCSNEFAWNRLQAAAKNKFDADGKPKERRGFKPDQVERWFGYDTVLVGIERFVVRPIRERCRHYRRQVLALDGTQPGETGHHLVFRNCTMRRSVGGAFLSLRDEAVYACDYRDPVDRKSAEKYLDGPDRKKLKDRPDLTLVPLFGGEGEDIHIEDGGNQ
jgi:hypothetical protein